MLLLAGAKSARGAPYAAWSIVSRLCSQHYEADQIQNATNHDWWAALLAGQLLLETGIYKRLDPLYDKTDIETLARVRSWLMGLVSGGNLPPIDRVKAGRILGWLGDERPGVGVIQGIPDIDWLEVKVKPFIMGGDGPWDGNPQFNCDLNQHNYYVSRYPITVTQYRAFVEAGGYNHAPYWEEAAAQGIWEKGYLLCQTWSEEQHDYVTDWVRCPAEYGLNFCVPNQPCIGISWYEALAFCRWLGEVLAEPVYLPTEAEWEYAARYTDGRIYPWGNRFNSDHCNTTYIGIASPSPVGSFPSGKAQCGAVDMAGNVWEWCSTQWRNEYTHYDKRVNNQFKGGVQRVVRGGSFIYVEDGMRCAFRGYFRPDLRHYHIGLRVIRYGSERENRTYRNS